MSQENGEAAANGPVECLLERPNSHSMSCPEMTSQSIPQTCTLKTCRVHSSPNQLQESFKKAGFDPVTCKVLVGNKYPDRSAGFCRMKSREDCKRAIQALNGKYFELPGNNHLFACCFISPHLENPHPFVVDSRGPLPLVVKFAKSKRPPYQNAPYGRNGNAIGGVTHSGGPDNNRGGFSLQQPLPAAAEIQPAQRHHVSSAVS